VLAYSCFIKCVIIFTQGQDDGTALRKGPMSMSMSIGSFKCPQCGGELSGPEGRSDLYCQYCGAHLFLDDGTIRYHVTLHDDAEVYRVELERERFQLQKELIEYRSRWVRQLFACVAVWGILGLLLLLVSTVLSSLPGFLQGFFRLLAYIWFLFMFLAPVALFVKRPSKYVSKL